MSLRVHVVTSKAEYSIVAAQTPPTTAVRVQSPPAFAVQIAPPQGGAGGLSVVATQTPSTITVPIQPPPGYTARLAAVKGPPGSSGTVEIGSVTASEPGGDASVVNTGTPSAAVLDFTLPRGEPGPPLPTYVHVQDEPAQIWLVNHNLGRLYPPVSVVDSANTVVIPDVEYLNVNSLHIINASPFGGKAAIG